MKLTPNNSTWIAYQGACGWPSTQLDPCFGELQLDGEYADAVLSWDDDTEAGAVLAIWPSEQPKLGTLWFDRRFPSREEALRFADRWLADAMTEQDLRDLGFERRE